MLEELGLRIRNSRVAAGLSQIDLARLCGWESQSRISGYERGVREPKQADLEAIAAALNTDVAWIAFGRKADATNNVSEGRSGYGEQGTAPVISWEDAGNQRDQVGFGLPDRFMAMKSTLGKPEDGRPQRGVPAGISQRAFWLKVVGDSMTNPHGQPSVPEGAFILVDPDLPVVAGKLVVARLTTTNEVTFKRLVSDAGRRWLKPLNPDYPMIELDGNFELIGVARKMEIDL